MITPEIKDLVSVDLERPKLPADPHDCLVALQAKIGPSGSAASESFAFTVVTPSALRREERFRWGRGLLVVPAFSWEIVDLALARLLARCSRPSWEEVAQELNQELEWEFDHYREHTRA